MLEIMSLNIRRVGVSKTKLAVIAVIAFLTLSFFAIGFSAVEEARGSPAAAHQQAGDKGDHAAVTVFKFV